jgi:hypothetical protein
VLSDETLTEIKKEISKFKQFSTAYNVSDKDAVPDFDHSLSDLFMYSQTVSDKMVADCVESLIGTYVYVSMINNNIGTYSILFFTICFHFRTVELK